MKLGFVACKSASSVRDDQPEDAATAAEEGCPSNRAGKIGCLYSKQGSGKGEGRAKRGLAKKTTSSLGLLASALLPGSRSASEKRSGRLGAWLHRSSSTSSNPDVDPDSPGRRKTDDDSQLGLATQSDSESALSDSRLAIQTRLSAGAYTSGRFTGRGVDPARLAPFKPKPLSVSSAPTAEDVRRRSTLSDLDVIETHKMKVDSVKGSTFVNQYIMIQTLGRGTFGKVKLCLNTCDSKLYAIKLINKSVVGRAQRMRSRGSSQSGSTTSSGATIWGLDATEDVVREISVMKRVSHPNLVRLHEVIDDPENSKLLLVMDFVEGGPVMCGPSATEKMALPEAVAVRYFRDIVQGLDYLHANKIVHGDLKPDNLLLSAAGMIKISDFGSSRMFARGDTMLRTVGTPAFLAPEMCEGKPYHGRTADIWALGICLFMFVYGSVPFQAATVIQLYDAIRDNPLEFPVEPPISPALRELIEAMLVKDPNQRIKLADIIKHDWVTYAGTRPILSCADTLPEPQLLEDSHEEPEVAEVMQNPLAKVNEELCRMCKLISPLIESREYGPGEIVFRAGDPANCVIYVEEGTCVMCYDHQLHNSDDDFIDEVEDEDSDSDSSGLPEDDPDSALGVPFDEAGPHGASFPSLGRVLTHIELEDRDAGTSSFIASTLPSSESFASPRSDSDSSSTSLLARAPPKHSSRTKLLQTMLRASLKAAETVNIRLASRPA